MRLSLGMDGDDDIRAKFTQLPDQIADVVAAKMADIGEYLVEYIQDSKLSGQVLKEKTGRLKASIGYVVEQGNQTATLSVGSSDVDYANILEGGGTTSPHIIEPTAAQVLAFYWNGMNMFLKRVNHPGSNIPAFDYLGSALRENDGLIRTEIANAINEGFGNL